MTHLKVGTISHYYDKLNVAVVDLTGTVHLGDHIQISGSTDFSQTIDSLQVEHEQVESAVSGDTVGLKVNQPVVPGDEILKSS